MIKGSGLHAGLFVETVHPAFSTSDLDVKRRRHTTLKRLDFVRAYTEYYWSKANTIASMVRAPPAQFALPVMYLNLRAVRRGVGGGGGGGGGGTCHGFAASARNVSQDGIMTQVYTSSPRLCALGPALQCARGGEQGVGAG